LRVKFLSNEQELFLVTVVFVITRTTGVQAGNVELAKHNWLVCALVLLLNRSPLKFRWIGKRKLSSWKGNAAVGRLARLFPATVVATVPTY
jgi:hypothetical protein